MKRSLIALKNSFKLLSISRSLFLSPSCSPLLSFFSLLYSITSPSSLLLACLKRASRFSSVLMKSSMEQFLMRQSMLCSQKRAVCSRHWKKMGSRLVKKSNSCVISRYCRRNSSSVCSYSVSFWLNSSLARRYSSKLLRISSKKVLKRLEASESCMRCSVRRQQSTMEKRRSLEREKVSSTRRSSLAMLGVTAKLRQLQRKQASSMSSWRRASMLSLHLRSRSLGCARQSSSVRRLFFWRSLRWVKPWRMVVRNSQFPSTSCASLFSLYTSPYSISMRFAQLYIIQMPRRRDSTPRSNRPRHRNRQSPHRPYQPRRRNSPQTPYRSIRQDSPECQASRSHDRHRQYSPDRRRAQHRPRPRSPSPRQRRRRIVSVSSPTPPSPSSSSSSSSHSSSSSVSSSTRRRRSCPHFKYRSGEKLGHKYRVTRLMGTGTFGRVLEGTYREEMFAIKVIKPVAKYVESAKTERNIVKTLNSLDEDNSHHIVRFHESFYHHQFFCLVFEPLGLSLYDLVKKNGHHGYPPRFVQSFARQTLTAIAFMHAHAYTHTDLKPENILLVSDIKRAPHPTADKYYLPESDRVKLIDFGGATHRTDRHSSIINTRQYRSPEVILQCCQWDELSDVWSIGCIIAELATGELLFPTHDDFQHLIMIEKAAGPIPKWMGNACSNELKEGFTNGQYDTKRAMKRLKDVREVVGFKTVNELLNNQPELCDLLNKCLDNDPKKRISCKQALKHPFFNLTNLE